MGLVIDTSALIDVERSAPADAPESVWEKLLPIIGAEAVAIPTIVVAELWAGAALADTALRAAGRRRQIESLIASLPVADFDGGTAEIWGALFGELTRQGRMIPSNDLIVASVAKQLSFGVLVGASGERHFNTVPGLRVEVLRLPA